MLHLFSFKTPALRIWAVSRKEGVAYCASPQRERNDVKRFTSSLIFPFCKDCVYFNTNKQLTKATCNKFKEYDVVSGEITPSNAYAAREDPRKCDTIGIHFEPAPKQYPFDYFGPL